MTHERHHTITKAHLQLKSNTSYKLEEVEKTLFYVEFFIASDPLEKDYTTFCIKLD